MKESKMKQCVAVPLNPNDSEAATCLSLCGKQCFEPEKVFSRRSNSGTRRMKRRFLCMPCCVRQTLDCLNENSESNVSMDSVGDFSSGFPSSNIKLGVDRFSNAVCLIQDSPFRILRVAESGNVKEFTRLVTNDSSKLNVRDGRGRAAVHQATIKNHVQILEALVCFNGDLDLTDNHGNTAVHLAIEFNCFEALNFLLANGANPRLMNDRNQSPLHLAAEVNNSEALKILSKFRNLLDPNMGGEHGRTALHLAAIYDHEECMRILLYDLEASPKRPDNHGFYPIHEAAKHASSRSMEILLSWGDSHGCPREEMTSLFDAEGNIPLHSAVHGGDIKAVQLCLSSGAKISTQQHDLSTAVHLACSQGSMEIVKLMFTMQPEEKETCLKSCDLQRHTPLHCASMFDHYELVEYLVSQGASVNVLDKEHRSPMHLAAVRNGWKTIRTLIKLGAKITIRDNDQRNILHAVVIHSGQLENLLDDDIKKNVTSILEDRDKHGYTPLHYAAKKGQIVACELFLQLGASIIKKNNEGQNVFHIACRYGRLNIINKILKIEQNNSVINEGDGKGMTPLHISSSEGHVRVVQALMKKGALLHRDHTGNTPLHLAARNGHCETIKLLLNVHSHLLDQVDKDGNTPLHVAAWENQSSAANLLLTRGCSLTYNFRGYSAIDNALQNKFLKVAHVMVTHDTRGDEILGMNRGHYPSIMLALVSSMPQIVSAVLDRCIIKSDVRSDSDSYYIKYDFKWLSLETDEESLEKSKADEGTEKDSVSVSSQKRHLPILNGMVASGRVELLSHVISQKYLHMKWNAYGKYIHISQLLLYLLFLTVLTVYASDHVIDFGRSYENNESGLDASQRGDERASRPVEIENDANDGRSSFFSSMNESLNFTNSNSENRRTYHFITALFITFVCVANMLREVLNVYYQKIKYLMDSVNWVYWVMNTSCLFMVLVDFLPGLAEYANPSASIAVFLGWFYLLLFLQRFNLVGIYVTMFLEILHTLVRVLMIFSILIIAFGLAFHILMSDGSHQAFNDVPKSLMKTFSMMLGDLNFEFFLFHLCSDSSDSSKEKTAGSTFRAHSPNSLNVPSYVKGALPGQQCIDEDDTPASSFLILGIFMVLMPILLMNLLIGLAVGDIESVRRNAQLKRLAMQVQLHTGLEKTLPEFLLRKVNKKEVIEYPNLRKTKLGVWEQIFKYFQPKSLKQDADNCEEDELVTDDVVTALYQSNELLSNMSTQLEKLETLMTLLCSKMDLCTEGDYLDEGTQIDEGNPMMEVKGKMKRTTTVKIPPRLKSQRSDSSNI